MGKKSTFTAVWRTQLVMRLSSEEVRSTHSAVDLVHRNRLERRHVDPPLGKAAPVLPQVLVADNYRWSVIPVREMETIEAGDHLMRRGPACTTVANGFARLQDEALAILATRGSADR